MVPHATAQITSALHKLRKLTGRNIRSIATVAVVAAAALEVSVCKTAGVAADQDKLVHNDLQSFVPKRRFRQCGKRPDV